MIMPELTSKILNKMHKKYRTEKSAKHYKILQQLLYITRYSNSCRLYWVAAVDNQPTGFVPNKLLIAEQPE